MSDLPAYDEPSAPAEMTADCRAAEARLDIHSVARTVHVPAPRIRLDDLAKPGAQIATVARGLAARLGLDLD